MTWEPQHGACVGEVTANAGLWSRTRPRGSYGSPTVRTIAALVALIAVAGGQAAHVRRRYGEAPPGVPGIDMTVVPSGVGAHGERPLEVAVFGDSSVAGVGVHDIEEALPVQLAQRVSDMTGRPVHVVGHGVSGATTRDVLVHQISGADQAHDVSVLVVGTNDVTHVTPPAALARATSELFSALTGEGAPAVVSSLPELGAMRVLPNPLRAAARAYARLVHRVQLRAAERDDLVHLVDVRRAVGREFIGAGPYMSSDLFHPSAAGYGRIADTLAPAAVAALRTRQAGVVS